MFENAKYIKAQEDPSEFSFYDPAPFFRKEFTLKDISEAKGATTLWEKWDGDNSGSHNHHMYSGVIAYFFRGLLGITPLENAAGFEKIELCPSFITELGYVKGSIQTVRGKIDAEWQTESGGFKYTVTLPENISATFRGRTLKKGINEFFVSQEEVL